MESKNFALLFNYIYKEGGKAVFEQEMSKLLSDVKKLEDNKSDEAQKELETMNLTSKNVWKKCFRDSVRRKLCPVLNKNLDLLKDEIHNAISSQEFTSTNAPYWRMIGAPKFLVDAVKRNAWSIYDEAFSYLIGLSNESTFDDELPISDKKKIMVSNACRIVNAFLGNCKVVREAVNCLRNVAMKEGWDYETESDLRDKLENDLFNALKSLARKVDLPD